MTTDTVLGNLEKVPLYPCPAHHTAHALALGVAVVPGCSRRFQEWARPPPGTPMIPPAPSPQEAGTQLSAKGKECVTGGLAASLPFHQCASGQLSLYWAICPPPEGPAWTPVMSWYIHRYSHNHTHVPLPPQLLGCYARGLSTFPGTLF